MRISTFVGTDPKDRPSRWLGGIALAAVAAIAGCSNAEALPVLQVYEVKGKVLLADGQPLSSGWIYFVPKGDLPITPSAAIGSDGSYSVVTGGSGEGAPVGDYKVRVESPQLQKVSPRSGKKPVIPQKYTDEDSSGLVVTVRAESNQLEPIRLK